MKVKKSYIALREFLDRFPLGFPQTDSGVEIQILEKLFSEEEAKIAVTLSPFPEEAVAIAQRSGTEEGYLSEKLHSMSLKGLIFRTSRGGKTLYNAAPFMIGIYEYSVSRMDSDLARLYEEYYELAYQDEMGKSNIPGFKAIPVGETVIADSTMLHFKRVEEEIRKARKIAVAPCICRKEARLNGKGCSHETETCLSFGTAAEYYIKNGTGREITADHALDILKKADDAGLVHAAANVTHLANICNCCPCCCASLKGIVEKGLPRNKFINPLYEPRIDAAACTGCMACFERCPVSAMSFNEVLTVDRDSCLGCGLCTTGCPSGAIVMMQRRDSTGPYERMLDLGLAILKGKGDGG